MANAGSLSRIDRRSLLVGGGAAAGLLLAWGVWPRSYRPNLNAAPGETIFNAFLKIGTDGHVSVVVPQAEMGQGVTTSLPQILADELGADWRTIAVEPAPISPLYANDFLMADHAPRLPGWLQPAGAWAVRQYAVRSAFMVTAGSSSIRGFEQRYREAGAAARALLCMAAAERWGVDWLACDTRDGFVVRGKDRVRFGALAAAAAGYDIPSSLPLRAPGAGGISGQPMPRIDLPSKVDGMARFAGDVRLPGLVYASIRHGPLGDTTFAGADKARAHAISGLLAIVENPGWIAAVATNWWAANRALDTISPRFTTAGPLPDDASIEAALVQALNDGGTRFFGAGTPDDLLAGAGVISADYRVPLVVHAPIEPLVATAQVSGDRLEVWLPTQGPNFAREAVARATGHDPAAITVYPMLVGGGFGRKIATEAAEVAAILAIKLRRPVQLCWSRAEEIMRDHFRPPAIGRLKARLAPGGGIAAWSADIATPSTAVQQLKRLGVPLLSRENGPDAAAVEGGVPSYRIAAVSLAHHAADIGVPTGMWRSDANSYTAFFNESFVDELARAAGIEPLSYRMQMLGKEPRLARCLTTVAMLGDWQGGVEGSGQGIAAHSCYGSHVAMLAEVSTGDGGTIRADRIVAVVDCGRMIHPDIVRQQIEGGIIWGLSAALGSAIGIDRGLVTARNFHDLKLITLETAPDITVELIENREAPGGVGEIAVPPVAPAVANAVFAATGKRLRSLPLRLA